MKDLLLFVGLACAGAIVITACGGDAASSPPPAAASTQGPRVVDLDKGALPLDPPPVAKVRKTQFKTVADVAAFAAANMPAGRAGSLKEHEYWSILAFDLKANGVTLDRRLDLEVAKATPLH